MDDVIEGLGWSDTDRPSKPLLQPMWERARDNWKACIKRAVAHLTHGRVHIAGEWLTLAANIEKDWFNSSGQTRDVCRELARRTGVVFGE